MAVNSGPFVAFRKGVNGREQLLVDLLSFPSSAWPSTITFPQKLLVIGSKLRDYRNCDGTAKCVKSSAGMRMDSR